MKSYSMLVCLLLGAGFIWSSARAVNQQPEKQASLSQEDLARAKTLFGEKCARCHGADGRGQTVLGDLLEVPDFTNEKWWKEHGNDDELIKVITNGKGEMPTFGKKVSKTEISLLAEYVRQFNPAASPDLSSRPRH